MTSAAITKMIANEPNTMPTALMNKGYARAEIDEMA